MVKGSVTIKTIYEDLMNNGEVFHRQDRGSITLKFVFINKHVYKVEMKLGKVLKIYHWTGSKWWIWKEIKDEKV